MTNITFCIPIGPAHVALSHRAIDSVAAQTIPCEWLAMTDTDHRGPGYLRNQMLSRVKTDFVVFLDADDWVEPTFAEETLLEYQRIGGNKYIFTDWLDASNNPIAAPCKNGPQGTVISVPDNKPYCGGTWHVLTTLIPTAWAREVGGFDESLPAVEDTEFYMKLCVTMRCGHRLAKPLFHYSDQGTRARDFHDNTVLYHQVMGELTRKYGGKVGCCGGDSRLVPPTGEKQLNDVQAMALWHGNRSEYGRVTGRIYPRMSFPTTAWVDPADIIQSPGLWRKLDAQPVDRIDGITQISTLGQMAMSAIPSKPAPMASAAQIVEPPAPIVNAKPDIKRVINLAKQADEPIFIFSDKDYPSYSDIRRLVELSGFKSTTVKAIDAFSRNPLIVVSPELIPDLNGLKARVICWQLEYAGDYIHNYDGFTGEVWGSDKAWADEHGAKYVLMGSHPDLLSYRYGGEFPPLPEWDVTMLGYMTPRRQAIKDSLSDLRWPIDYPGHDTSERSRILYYTKLMLHVHQHEDKRYLAPQRIAAAAAAHMALLCEVTWELESSDRANIPMLSVGTNQIGGGVRNFLVSPTDIGQRLHDYLCVEHPFRRCVEEALKS